VLEQLTAVPVDDRLRQPGGSAGEQDVERVVERDGRELERRIVSEQLLPPDRARQLARAVGHVHDVLERRQRRAQGSHLLAPIDVPVAVDVAGDRKQDLRLDPALQPGARPRHLVAQTART
jgi:hypothetical protein